MHKPNTIVIAMGLTLGLQLPAFSGEPPAVEPAPPSNPGDFCSWLQNKPGTLFKDKENRFLQEFALEGRLHFNMAHLEGEDVNGDDFSSEFNEFRRFRLGAKAKFLQYFAAKVSFDLVGDDRIDPEPNTGLGWGYEQIDEAYLSFDLGKALGGGPFETLMVNYGRQKFKFGHEARTSSNELLTPERSAISNKVYGSYRPTGVSVDAEMDAWSFSGALYSSSVDGDRNQAFNGWQDSVIYYASAGYAVSDQLKLRADFVYNDADVNQGEDSLLAYEWASSINAEYDGGDWGVIGDFIYGDNGDANTGNVSPRDGDFWGAMVMPYYWLVDERLQLVGQYQYGGADSDEGIRINSRYGRARGTDASANRDVNSGRGDNHHSVYGGLNYYLCGHNAKIQGGVEWQTMDTPAGDFDTLTYLLAFRTSF